MRFEYEVRHAWGTIKRTTRKARSEVRHHPKKYMGFVAAAFLFYLGIAAAGTHIFAQAPTCDALRALESRKADLKYNGVYYFPGELDSVPVRQKGIAHYYGDGEPLNAITASGKPFDPDSMTAASWFFPLGTVLEVTNTATGKSERVTVDDRGPNRVSYPWVIIDLTRGASERINPDLHGAIEVEVRPVCR